ncbi:MAG: hypothetical protein HDR27_02925 [Lachnospiraceae bacterium]|nr:hypothetical protein [Lachnospiraceae bacterium]
MMVATIAILKKTLAEMKTSSEKLFQGEITISKKECWLIGLVLVLSGITIGLLKAPLTHGITLTIGSNNGNNNGNNSANDNNGCGTSDMAENAVEELCKPITEKKEDKKKCGKRNRREHVNR